MTIKDLKLKVDTSGGILIDILYNLYKDLFSNLESSDTVGDIGLYAMELINKYGKAIYDEFQATDEMKELLNDAQKVD